MNDIENDLLIRELEESVKQDRLNKLWADYGSYIIGGAVIIVLATAFFSFYGSYTAKQNAHNTRLMLEARESENAAERLTAIAEEFKPGQRSLALLMAAGRYVEDGAYDKAIRAYKDIEESNRVPDLYKDLGTVLAVKAEWGFAEDKPEASQLLARLKPVMTDMNSPWRWHALVQAALIAAHDQADYEQARKYLAPVVEQTDLPPSLTERARALDHIYSLKQAEQNDQEKQGRAPRDTEAG